MTHTQNRLGLSNDRPGEEIVFLCMVHNPEKPLKAERIKDIAQIIIDKEPENLSLRPLGFDNEKIKESTSRYGVVTAVFTDQGKAIMACKEIKARKLGISVVISALYRDVHDICQNLNLTEHTYNITLGIFGNRSLLPERQVLAITTQCGHHMVSSNLVTHLVKKIQRTKMTIREAAELLVKPCVCGVVNPERVEKILQKMAFQDNFENEDLVGG